jgi:ribonuclease HI
MPPTDRPDPATTPTAARDDGAAAGRPITVATDGSALGNPGPGGWAWVRTDGSSEGYGYGGDRTTNNAMELTAIAAALRAHPTGPITIISDSRYAIDCVTKWVHGWRRRGWRTAAGSPVANRELVETIVGLAASRDVTYQWVRGHAGHPANERADTLARNAATNRR